MNLLHGTYYTIPGPIYVDLQTLFSTSRSSQNLGLPVIGPSTTQSFPRQSMNDEQNEETKTVSSRRFNSNVQSGIQQIGHGNMNLQGNIQQVKHHHSSQLQPASKNLTTSARIRIPKYCI
jgi:hypothetical protein